MRYARRFAIEKIRGGTGSASQLGRTVALAIAAAMLCAALPVPVMAQQYRSDTVDDKAKLNRTTALRAVKNPANYASDKARFDEFFQKYYFPAMTLSDPRALENLGELRAELFSRYLWATTNEQLQDDLTAMAFKAMVPIVVSKGDPAYHPAVRYNAILTIGLLDEQYAIESGANRRPPTPLADANKFLLQVLAVANADKPIPPSLVVGTLVGLERHARYHESLPPEAVEKMADEVLKIANRETPIVGVNREVFRWIQLQAARTLAKLGTVGADNKIHNALVRLVADEKLGIDNRLAVAAQLANLNYEGATVDGQAACDGLLAVARALSIDEARRAREFEDLRIGGSYAAPSRSYGEGGFSPGGGYGGAYGEEVRFERRLVLARVIDLRAGLSAIQGVAPPEAQPKIEAIVASINEVASAATDKNMIDLDVVKAVRNMLVTIDNNATPPAVADDAMAEDAFASPADDAAAAQIEEPLDAPAAETPEAVEPGDADTEPAAAPAG